MLRVFHQFDRNAGFFSCCSVKLNQIVDYFNENKRLPMEIENDLFHIYKPKYVDDVTYHYFMRPLQSVDIPYVRKVDYHHKYQFNDYKTLDFKTLNAFVSKYFSPSDEIIQLVNRLIIKYNLNPENYCAVYYRGTDKFTETDTGEFETYFKKMDETYKKNNNVSFIIQSDNQYFIDEAKVKFPNAIVFDENKTSYTKKGIHYEHSPDENYNIQKNFLAIAIVISKCKYIIMSSGNCSIWMILFRGHANDVMQFYSKVWYEKFQLPQKQRMLQYGFIGVK
jgi:hypothetical protein